MYAILQYIQSVKSNMMSKSLHFNRLLSLQVFFKDILRHTHTHTQVHVLSRECHNTNQNACKFVCLMFVYFKMYWLMLPSLSWSGSLFSVLQGCVCNIWILWQEVNEHIDIVLRRSAHLLHHSIFSHGHRCAVCHADEAEPPGGAAQLASPLQMGEICLPVWHW